MRKLFLGLAITITAGVLMAGITTYRGIITPRAAYIDADGSLKSSDATATELGYLSGVTSALQTQISTVSSTAGAAIANSYGKGTNAQLTTSTNLGNLIVTNGFSSSGGGFASYATNAVMTVASTGATNSTGVNQTAWLTAATGLQLYDNAGTAIWSGTQAIAAITPITVQPGGSFTGTSITSVGTHAF